MKKLKSTLLLALCLLMYNSQGQFMEGYYWAQEFYRSGTILNYTRATDGVIDREASSESVGNIIHNMLYEQNGVYARIEAFSIVTVPLLEQDQNSYWSFNITLGAYLNDDPLDLGLVSMYYGLGVDADLSSFVIDDGPGPNQKISFESGTIGPNLRVDLEILEFIQIRNSLTYGWWKADGATRWDFRSTIGVDLGNGFYPTIAPNFLSIVNDKTENGSSVREESTQFYLSFGFGIEF